MQKINEDDGAGLAEYSILVGGIAVVAVVAVGFFGGDLQAWYNTFGSVFG